MKKQVIKLTTSAVTRLKQLQKDNQLLRISTKKKGCSGISYSLEFTSQPSKFDEIVKQDGVTVVVDSKALFTLIGSEMDYREDELTSKFTFNNPNVKEVCGCGESFST